MLFKLPTDYDKLDSWGKRKVREQYVAAQGHKCYYCQSSLLNPPPKEITNKVINWDKFPPNFLRYPIHLQHNHNTGLTEGAVHAYCNAVMWQYEKR